MDAGIHPTAILNFLAHHGAGFFEKTGLIYGDELSRQSVVIEEMAKNFVLERVTCCLLEKYSKDHCYSSQNRFCCETNKKYSVGMQFSAIFSLGRHPELCFP